MNSNVQQVFNTYPKHVLIRLQQVRSIIFKIAKSQDLGEVTETLKWGEPSYLVKTGSTLRYDWKPATPHKIYIFFNCKTKLVDTFKQLYANVLAFEGNRAIVLDINQPLPVTELSHCIALSLVYKKVKHLPLLGC